MEFRRVSIPAREEGITTRTYVGITTVQDGLIAPAVLADGRQRLNDPQSQLLPLLVLVHSNVLNVTDTPKAPQELALNEHTADSDYTVCVLVDDDELVVRSGCGPHGVELLDPCCLTRV